MKIKVFHLVLSHMIVAVCYNQIMTIFSSSLVHQYTSSNADAASFVAPGGAKQIRRRDDSSFSACLLVMDENFRLQEWIAYAYLTLPLRYLVVTVDPKSKVSPTEKLDIFRSELNMTIIEWSDKDFSKWTPLPDHANISRVRMRHRARQNRFYERCMKHLYDQGQSWTALYDTDEFLVFNKFNHDYKPRANNLKSPASMATPGSVLNFIHQAEMSGTSDRLLSNTCYMIPRLLYGARDTPEHELQSSIPVGATVETHQLDTIRWRYHNPGHKKAHNGPPKVVIDVSRLGPLFPLSVESPHRPVHEVCGPKVNYDHIKGSPFRINHYLGSWEAYSFREDSRKGAERSREVWEFRAKNASEERSDHAVTWLKGFYGEVGVEKANTVLQGAGIPKSYVPKDDSGWKFQREKLAFTGKHSVPKDFGEFLREKENSAKATEGNDPSTGSDLSFMSRIVSLYQMKKEKVNSPRAND